ncbi:MAG: response regulator transcription factor [Anaerolineae bacterium]|nr:response regulator transcription factor [Anaerolineae bacterium]MCB0223720.1 response regulator transcription factor [Anaerolineae bacterium]MCB9109029.1 response regulator transcription factor [Anaerolineales bacterium]
MVVDDHALFRDGMVSVVTNQPDMEVVGEASDGLEAFIMAQQLQPNVILMDINMPGTDGLEATRLITQALPDTHIIMLTVRDNDEQIFEAIRNGAVGYLLKTIRARDLIDMIHAAAKGQAALSPGLALRVMSEFRRLGEPDSAEPATANPSAETDTRLEQLTDREQEVLNLVAEGLSDKEISEALYISLYTVKSHVRNILSKLHVKNRREAARLAKK